MLLCKGLLVRFSWFKCYIGILYQYFLIWLFVPLVNNTIRGYYDVTNETEWLRNRVITNISYSSSTTLSNCMVAITQRGVLILQRTGNVVSSTVGKQHLLFYYDLISCTTAACFSTFYQYAMVPTLVEKPIFSALVC